MGTDTGLAAVEMAQSPSGLDNIDVCFSLSNCPGWYGGSSPIQGDTQPPSVVFLCHTQLEKGFLLTGPEN